MLNYVSSVQEVAEDCSVVKLYQVNSSLLKQVEIGEENHDLFKFLHYRFLYDNIALNPAYYEQTALLAYCDDEEKGATDDDILSEVYHQFNLGELLETHLSYSLSINDVIEIDNTFYRVTSFGFKLLDDWNSENTKGIPFITRF